MIKKIGLMVLLCLALAASSALAQDNNEGKPPPPLPVVPAREQVVFSGKVLCSLTRSVPLPFAGLVDELKAKSGDKVDKGQVLATYTLSPEVYNKLETRLNPPSIRELEIELARAQRNAAELQLKDNQVQRLAAQDLAPPESLAQAAKALELAQRQVTALAARLRQARDLLKQDRELLREQLGNSAPLGKVPRQAAMISPIDGHVIWVHPDLRPGAEMPATSPAFKVGVMQPMLVQAEVYETEALRLHLGDAAEVAVESLPGRSFTAKVSRLSWSPVTLDPLKPSYYEVELILQNPDLALRPGLKATVTVRKPR